MFTTELQRKITAVVGAFTFTIVSVGAAVGPARAVETDMVAVAQIAAPVAISANV